MLRPKHSNSICVVKTALTPHFKLVLSKLRQNGFLLESDPKLPSVGGLLTGGPLKGSWWSHPLAQTIFQVNERLADHPDVLIAKLVSGKVTFVHKSLWPEVVAVGRARESWQTRGLSTTALRLLGIIDEAGTIRTDALAWPKSAKSKPGEAARELEKTLLVSSEQIHTESGAHAKVIETWGHWAVRRGFKAPDLSPAESRQSLEARLATLNEQFRAAAKLPWQAVR